MKVLTHRDAGLVVFQQSLDPGLARTFEDECKELASNPLPEASVCKDKGQLPFEVFAYSYSSETLASSGLSAITKILKNLGKETGYTATINCQLPKSKGQFHDDYRAESQMTVIHASNGGLFEFAPNALTEEEAEKTAQKIEVNAGDMVVQHNTDVLHRGINPSDHNRYNMVVWRLKPLLDQSLNRDILSR